MENKTCPHIVTLAICDYSKLKVYNGPNYCSINNKVCLLQSEPKCPIQEEIKNDNGE